MWRGASLAGLALAALAVAPPTAEVDARSAPIATQEPVFPTATQLVTIDAVVVDRDGRPVRGLTRADFELDEDGETRAISHFEAVTVAPHGARTEAAAEAFATSSNEAPPTLAPRSFVIVYDDLHIAPLRAAAARDAVASFLRREVRAGERAAVVVAGSGAWWTAEIPEGREDLLAFLDGQASGQSAREDLSDAEALRIVEYDDAATLEWVVERRIRQGRCQDLCEFQSPCVPEEGRRACSDEVRAEALRRNAEARHALRRTLAAMASAMAGVAAERGRKSLVLVSQGFVFDAANPAYREVVQASLRANTAIHFLDVRGLVATSPVSDVGRRGDFPDALQSVSEEVHLAAAGAEQVAEDSGGFAIRHGNDLGAGLARVAREAETYYLLGYEPPRRPGSDGFRKVRVRVARPGSEVRARKGYFVDASGRVEEPGELPPLSPAKPRARREPLRPSLVPRRDVRLLAAAYVGPPAGRDRAKVRLVAEVDRASLGGEGATKHEIEIRGDIWPRDGKQWVGLDRRVALEAAPAGAAAAWHLFTWDVALPPGVYQARLRLSDVAAGREGTLTHRFEVPEPRGLRFASPVVTDVLRRDVGGPPSLVAGAARVFDAGPGRSLYVQLELLGVGAPRAGQRGVTARVRLRDEAGREVRAVPPGPVVPDADDRLVRALGFALDELAPGRYVLSLEGRDERTGATCSYEEALVLKEPRP
jgi:VWFA-related protein